MEDLEITITTNVKKKCHVMTDYQIIKGIKKTKKK